MKKSMIAIHVAHLAFERDMISIGRTHDACWERIPPLINIVELGPCRAVVDVDGGLTTSDTASAKFCGASPIASVYVTREDSKSSAGWAD